MRYLIIGGSTYNESAKENEEKIFQGYCKRIGQAIAELGGTLIICSPFKDSADYWVINGFDQNESIQDKTVQINFVDSENVCNEVGKLESELMKVKISKIPHPELKEDKSFKNSWMTCQIIAMEQCDVIIVIGGKLDGSANMLLLLAEAKKKTIIPLVFLGGAAAESFKRRRYEYEDRLGRKCIFLQEEKYIKEAITLSKNLYDVKYFENLPKETSMTEPKFFISYSRARAYEADYIETLLRRRNMRVFRDESDFGAGSNIPIKIEEEIHDANVFIAVWCREYACSPWCFDELELALDKHDAGKMEIWIICIDNTRIVPKRARNLNYYSVRTREDIESRILNLLECTFRTIKYKY